MANFIHNHLSAADPILKQILQEIDAVEIASTKNLFHDLMSCIIEQQIHYRSNKKTFQKLLDKAGITMLESANFHVLEEKSLCDIKLSMSKYETINSILEYWENEETDWEHLSNEEIKDQLSSIKGIGQWTIDMLLIYTYNRPDVFSFDDYHIKKIMTDLYDLNPKSRLKEQMKEIAAAWSPFQAVAFKTFVAWKKQQKR